MQATKKQKIAIRRNCGYNVEVKEELVQWATNDNDKKSLNDLSFDQANKIIEAQTGKKYKSDNWGIFDRNNSTHMYIMSLLHQTGWTVTNDKYGKVPDLDRLSEFLKSGKSPVNKPLRGMKSCELEKTIKALQGIINFKYK